MCGVVWNYTGLIEEAENVFKPIINEMKPDFQHVREMPYPALRAASVDGFYPTGLNWYWRADFINEISDHAVEQHQKFGEALPTPGSTMHLYPIDGAGLQRVGKNDTPWNFRDALWSQVIVGVDPDPANNEKITSWTKSYYDAIDPYSAGGAYVNFMMDEGEGQDKSNLR